MKKYIFPSLLLLIILGTSCNEKSSSDVLEFQALDFNSLCGWCVYGEQLRFNGDDNTVNYQIIDPCDFTNPIEVTERALTKVEIESINLAFEEVAFLSVAIANCGECYDGCEERIQLTKDGQVVHILQYDSSEYAELDPVQDLIDVLSDIRSSF